MNWSKMSFFTALIGGLTFTGCSTENTSNPETNGADSTANSAIVEEVNPHNLILVDHQKWVIDEGMRVSIDSIDWRLAAFNGATLEDYGALSSDLSRHTKTIISSCTMKGQAHDELHKWLMPFIDLRKELDSIANPAQGEEIATELKQEIIIFKTYFE